MISSPPKAALLVGVNDYSAYDASVGQAAGTSDLRGGREDVKRWYIVARRLGIPAENIDVRTTPELTAAEMPIDATGTRFGPATREGILEGVQALGAALSGAGIAQGLLTYSGHGAANAEGALLCPSDVTGPAMAEAISYPKLAAALDTHVPEHALTVILDTCHAAPTRYGSSSVRFLGASAPEAAPVVRAHDRVLASCGAGASSEEYVFQGVWHGAFTWAATTVLDRWPTEEREGTTAIGIDYADLVARANTLLGAVAFAQTSQFSGPVGDGAVAFGYPTSRLQSPTTTDPVMAPLKELDPGTDLGIYEIKQSGTVLGYVVAAATSQGGWVAGNEYWMWSGTKFPTTGWNLLTFTGTLPGWAVPANAIVFENKSFPNSTSTISTSPGGPWFSIATSSPGASIGWLNPNPTNSSPTSLTWYEYVPSGPVPSWIATLGGPKLYFTQVSRPGSLSNVSTVTDDQTNP